jgi:hypothetical protein
MLHAPVLIEFDAKNTTHRQHFHHFMKKNKWRESAPRFVLESPYVNVPVMIQQKLLEFYLNNEYKEKV